MHHLYYEPFLRSDYWVRLLTSPVEGGIGALLNNSDAHSGMVIIRYKEWWGDQGRRSDVLEVNGENILNPANTAHRQAGDRPVRLRRGDRRRHRPVRAHLQGARAGE